MNVKKGRIFIVEDQNNIYTMRAEEDLLINFLDGTSVCKVKISVISLFVKKYNNFPYISHEIKNFNLLSDDKITLDLTNMDDILLEVL